MVTVSPSGPPGLFKGVTTAMSGVLARFPLLLPVRNSVASYGASAGFWKKDYGWGVRVRRPFGARDEFPVPYGMEFGSVCVCVCVYYCRTFYKAVRVGEEESGGRVL